MSVARALRERCACVAQPGRSLRVDTPDSSGAGLMRTLFGMIVGAALTVGFAYLIDQRRLADPAG